MENEKQIYDYVFELITTRNKSSEKVIKALMKKGIDENEAIDIYNSVFQEIERKRNEPINQERAKAA